MNKNYDTNPVKELGLSAYLRQLYVEETILIDPTDGTKTIAQSKDVFKWDIDFDFVNWDLDRQSQPTPAMAVSVHKQIKNGMFRDIYGTDYVLLDKLCFTQHQIIDVCVQHEDKLRQGAFFLFKKHSHLPADEDNLFVADVDVHSKGRLDAYARYFLDAYEGSAEYPRRFVIPQLT